MFDHHNWESINAEQKERAITKAVSWYKTNQDKIESSINSNLMPYSPSGASIFEPSRWSPPNWAWILEKYSNKFQRPKPKFSLLKKIFKLK